MIHADCKLKSAGHCDTSTQTILDLMTSFLIFLATWSLNALGLSSL